MKKEFADKAKESLKSSQILFDNGLYDDSASRAYYAAFRAAIAALAHFGITSDDNDHKWLQANFTRELIHRKKVFDAKFRSYLPELIKIRLNADYSINRVSKKQAKHQLERANEFVEAVEKEINR